MNVGPATSFEAVIDTGDTGLSGLIEVGANDNVGGTAIAYSATGVAEIAAGVYAATRTSPDTQGQYTLIWRVAASAEVLGVEDLTVTFSAPAEPTPGPPVTAYATVDELARILQLTNPSVAQETALQRVLDSAATEIDAYLARTAPFSFPYPPLVVSVNLDRAADIWKSEQSPYGIVALGGDTLPSYPGRNSFRRHENRLLPLKEAWGVA